MPRLLLKNWKLNSIAVFSLAIAMALSIVALSVSNAILFRPPYAQNPERLISIYTVARDGAKQAFSFPDYRYFRDHTHVYSALAALHYSISKDILRFGDREELVMLNTVSDNYFDVMGIRPYLGRYFIPGDDQHLLPAAVLTYSCWRRWGADSHIVGQTITVNHQKLTILGVAPKEFLSPVFGIAADVIVNIPAEFEGKILEDRDTRYIALVGRLQPHATRAQAGAEAQALWAQLAAAYPVPEKDRRVETMDFTVLSPDSIQPARLFAALLIASALLILLVACANAANLLLALATLRRQEALIKTALGASRLRIIFEFLKETALLCAAGGVLGYALASAALAWLSHFDMTVPVFGSFPISADLHPDARVLALTFGLILLASLASGLAPALYVSKPNLATALSGETAIGGSRRGIVRNTVVLIQVAVCTLVLVGTGLCLRSLHNLRHVDAGFSARNIVAVWLFMDAQEYSKAQGIQLYDQLRRGAEQLYGVESVSLADGMPLGGESSDHDEILFPDRPATGQKTFVDFAVTDANYFSTFGIRILAGRAFNASDREGNSDVVVINHFMAEKFWPGQDPVGRAIRIANKDHPGQNRSSTIIGVAADGKYDDLDEPPRPYMYYSLAQHYNAGAMLIARTNGDPRLWVEPLSRMVRQLGVRLPVPPVTMENWLNLTLFVPLLTLACVSGLSVIGVVLATAGLYGAISYSVSERKRELGIRIALGAAPVDLLQLVFRETLKIAGVGVTAGLFLGIAATLIFRSQFFGIRSVEWIVLSPVAVGMVALSLLIAFLAARRWTRMNPMDAVRHA